MATQSLKHVFYPLYMDKPGSGVGEVRNKAYGVFATRLSTHRFLDIPDSKIFVGDIEREAKGGIRTFTLADGTVLSQSKENSDGKVADYVYTVKRELVKNVSLFARVRGYTQVILKDTSSYTELCFSKMGNNSRNIRCTR